MLQALFDVQDHVDWLQGTSPNETVHSWLKRFMPALGGNRSYALIEAGLCVGEWEYNLAKAETLARGDKQDKFLARVLASIRHGLDPDAKAQRNIALRRAWTPAMDAKYDLETLLDRGFKAARGKVRSLSNETLELLYTSFLCHVNDDDFVHTQNIYHFIQHHLAQRVLTKGEVSALVNYIRAKLAL